MTKSNNAVVILITSTNRVILVRDKKTKEWMFPGGKRDPFETDYQCALREFHEETSFILDPKYFTNIKYEMWLQRNKSRTKIFIINSIQEFPEYNLKKVHNFETDKLYYLKLKDLKYLANGKSHRIVKKLKNYVQVSLYNLIKKNII